jgi:competence protein ComEC
VLLFYLALAWLLGTVAADMLALPLPLWAAGVLVGALSAAAGRGRVRLAALCLLCVAGAGVRYELARVPTTPRSVWALAGGGEVALRGAALSDPKRTEEGQQVLLSVSAVRRGGRWVPAEGTVLLKLPPYPAYSYGQRLEARGALQEPRGAQRPGEFDYRAYLARRGIFALVDGPQVRVLPGAAGNGALRALLAFRGRCQAALLRALPEPQSSLAVGILLGLQASIPDDVYATFSATGTSHILVVSGWNMTILATMLAAGAERLRAGRWLTFGVTLAVIWTYSLFVGATPTVIRAALMASLAVFARSADRQSEPWTLLAVACWAMVAVDPNTLWDLGFQLSAGATASLFAYGKGTERLLKRFPPMRWAALAFVCEALTATLAAQILALPIILYNFGNLSIIAPVANVVLVPVVPYAMLLGTVALIGALVWPLLGQWLALGAYMVLAWLSEGARLLAGVPYAAVQIPPFPLWALLAYYALVIGGWLWARGGRIAGEAPSEKLLGGGAFAGAD